MDLFKIWEVSATDANGNPVHTEGIGTLKLVLNGSIFHLRDARYTPSVSATLVSLGQLDRQGYDMELVQMDEGLRYFHLTDPNRQIFSAPVNAQNVYPLQKPCYVLMARTPAIAAEPMEIWHRRLGHLHAGGIIQLSKDL